MDFTALNLNKPLLRALETMELNAPTPIQQKAFPVIMSGRDVVGVAQTGTGKTVAYLLPVLRMLEYSQERHPRVLILVPTRELVQQVTGVLDSLTQFMSVRYFGIFGASNINTQKQRVFQGLDILVATPGRLIDLMLAGSVKLTAIRKVIIDEADEMLSLGFRSQLVQVLDALPLKKQSLLFSATLTPEVEGFIRAQFRDPLYVETAGRNAPVASIVQRAYFAPNYRTKVNLLVELLRDERLSRVVLFVRNRQVADALESDLAGVRGVSVIHANKSQPNRFAAVRAFQENESRLLIATDVIARGLDLADVTHVINFNMPSRPEVYIHRMGRTGRAGKGGEVISFVAENEKPMLRAVEESTRKNIPVSSLPGNVEVSAELLPEETPAVRDKNLAKFKSSLTAGGAFHEKKAKNKKVQLGGKRRQEKQRRALAKSRSKRGR